MATQIANQMNLHIFPISLYTIEVDAILQLFTKLFYLTGNLGTFSGKPFVSSWILNGCTCTNSWVIWALPLIKSILLHYYWEWLESFDLSKSCKYLSCGSIWISHELIPSSFLSGLIMMQISACRSIRLKIRYFVIRNWVERKREQDGSSKFLSLLYPTLWANCIWTLFFHVEMMLINR